MENSLKNRTYIINGEEFIGLDGYYYHPENKKEERLENFDSFEHYLKQERAKGNPHFTAYLLYCFKELKHMDFEDEVIAHLFPFVKAFVSKNQNEIAAFVSKWWDEESQAYHQVLDLSDAVEGIEDHHLHLDDQGNGYIIGIVFNSKNNQDAYFFEYPYAKTYEACDEFQLFIPKEKYEELMLDLYGIFED